MKAWLKNTKQSIISFLNSTHLVIEIIEVSRDKYVNVSHNLQNIESLQQSTQKPMTVSGAWLVTRVPT